MIIHYNCTIGSILLDSFLLIYHPYPPSFHEMIFILVQLWLAQRRLTNSYISTKNWWNKYKNEMKEDVGMSDQQK